MEQPGLKPSSSLSYLDGWWWNNPVTFWMRIKSWFSSQRKSAFYGWSSGNDFENGGHCSHSPFFPLSGSRLSRDRKETRPRHKKAYRLELLKSSKNRHSQVCEILAFYSDHPAPWFPDACGTVHSLSCSKHTAKIKSPDGTRTAWLLWFLLGRMERWSQEPNLWDVQRGLCGTK